MKRLTPILLLSTFFILLFATFTFASQPVKLYVNGKLLNPPVAPQIINGTTMVPLRSISEALNVPVSFDQASNSVIVGTPPKNLNQTPQPQAQTPTTQPQVSAGHGNIKGTITWQYNKVIGTKGDVGAVIILIPANYNPSNLTQEDLKEFYGNYKAPANTGIYTIRANGYGYYELNSIPTGNYVIFVSSANNFRDRSKPIDQNTINLIQPRVKNWDFFKLVFLGGRSYKCEKITIDKDRTLDYSHDFGYSYI